MIELPVIERHSSQDTQPQGFPGDLHSYDHYVVAFSGGKDSLAALLTLIERGVSPSRIQCWHHDVDGDPDDPATLMDWPCTASYCEAVADALGVDLYHSWKQGGFKGEMLRENERTKPMKFQTPQGVGQRGGTRGKKSTRLQFPQVSPDLSVRWCSAYLKIDVCASALRAQEQFRGEPGHAPRTLVITGERAQESASRAGYETFEPHKADLREGKRYQRHIDHWRPVHAWSERQVWEIIQRHAVRPHPAYEIGFGRVSCMTCIFGSARQFATVRLIAPERFEEIAGLEERFGKTMKRDRSLRDLVDGADPYDAALDNPASVRLALSHQYDARVALSPDEWTLPAGAFGESAGPS